MSTVFWTNFKTNFNAYFVKNFTMSEADDARRWGLKKF